MPTFPDINNIHVAQFKDTVDLLSQQLRPRIAGNTDAMSCYGEKSQAVINISKLDPSNLAAPTYEGGAYDGWYGDTAWDSVEHTQRWMNPNAYTASLPIAQRDLERMLTDPRSKYAETIVAGMNRKRDQILIAAATGSVFVGEYTGATVVTFPTTQILDVADASVDTPLTVDLLIDAKQKLWSNEVGVDLNEELFFVTNSVGMADLLRDEKLTSADYATVKALVAGETDSFMGFKFIMNNDIEIAAGGGGNRAVATNFAYARSGLMEGMWSNLDIRVDERPDKNYVWQIYATMTCGATRPEDVKVVAVESTNGEPVA